jgi:BlaI family transcriptional regulator, penicillinase repressor
MGTGLGLTDAEMEVLKVLWELGPSNVRAINSELERRGRRWAYTTVSTLLKRMADKGVVASSSQAIPHVYRATVLRDELLGRRLKEAADDLCDGEAAPLVLALVQGNRFTEAELARFQALLDAARRQPKGRK